MDKLKRKKINYIPGIISFTLLPLAFYFFAKREIQQSTIWTIPIIWADTTYMNKQDILFSSFKGHFPPNRNYTDIVFTGNHQDDKTKLAYAQIRIREILKIGDTSNGLHFVFNDSATYETFVGAIDKLRIEGAKTYMPLENNLWFYNFPSDTIKSFRHNCLLYDDVIIIQPEISWWTKTKEKFTHIWFTSWQLIILFGFFVFSILVLRRKNNCS